MGKWWQGKPMRFIQTNLREIDAALDVESFVQSLKDFTANVLLFNVGGIVANYPTALDFHFRNPYMTDDFTGKVLERVHQEGIKLIARFDFSRLNEQVAMQHQDWIYKSPKGEIVNYNGQVHTCINGEYQQQGSLQILEEVARKYPIDGVFFNMIGYVQSDYSYNYYGICHCDNCRARFSAMYGYDELPSNESADNPVFRDYEKFKTETVKELFERRAACVKGINENIAVCNYTHDGTDIFRKESISVVHKPLPEFNYLSSENVKTVMGSWEGMAVSNAAVHSVDFAMRHASVMPDFTLLRLAQDLMYGGWLDYFVIGTLTNQSDRLCYEEVKALFRYHKQHEEYYDGLQSFADACLIVPAGSRMFGSDKEFRGMFRILSEAHIPFDVIHDSVLDTEKALTKLQKYKVVLLPDVRSMSDHCASVLDEYVSQGGKLLATGFTSVCDGKGTPMNRVRLQSAGIGGYEFQEQVQGSYFRIRPEDKSVLKGNELLDLVYLSGEVLKCEPIPEAKGYLGLIPVSMFGPPEKAYITQETDIPGIIHNRSGQGECVYIPWHVGRHYERISNHGHSKLVMNALLDVLQVETGITTSASPLVEISSHRNRAGQHLISFVNLSGQLGSAFHKPLPIRNIAVESKVSGKPKRVHGLMSGEELPFEYTEQGTIRFAIEELNLLETAVIEFIN